MCTKMHWLYAKMGLFVAHFHTFSVLMMLANTRYHTQLMCDVALEMNVRAKSTNICFIFN